jgi:hypothetical protein
MRIVCREGKNVRSLSCFNGSNGWNGHLWKNVAEMAKGFAGEFGVGEWAYLAGLWH